MESILKRERTQKEQDKNSTRNNSHPPVTEAAELIARIAGGDEKEYTERYEWADAALPDELGPVSETYSGLVNLCRMNNIPRVNKLLEAANRRMEAGQYLVVCLETKDSRKERILNKFPKAVSYPYYTLDFVLKRVFPKWRPTEKIYFRLTKGRNRVISLSEALARLICCGFEIEGFKKNGHLTWITARKTGRPAYDMDPTYRLVVKLKRIGQHGRRINFYKFRTMHPYSEYLQEYLFEKNGTRDGDKIENDFRITRWGKWFRKFWIDELPMFYNLLKGDVKIVGVRPLSEHKFYTYPKELQEKRILIKPGLVPPYYADMPDTPEEFYATEERYLDSYLQKPLRTDIRYFGKAVVNILFRGARSK